MLKQLYIKNFTLIDELDIPLYPGFSVITGETGAGKSIILGAIGLLLGNRADSKAIKAAKKEHNAATLRLLGRLRRADVPGFPVGASGCALCETCAIVEHEPCRYPDLYYSCMSAYCIFVRRLAEQCGMEYDCGPGLLAFFGMYVFD